MALINPHLVFDLLAALLSLAGTYLVYRCRLRGAATVDIDALGLGYPTALVLGAVAGGYGFGTLNLIVSGIPGIGRSIVGSLAGAIVAIEIYKARKRITGSTGVIFVIGFATTVTIGRIGCFLSGLEDQTHGTPTSLPWAHDFGDGVLRHPVQLYESSVMAVFLATAALALYFRNRFFLRNGFYLMVATYALQRIGWEFLKPYTAIIGSLNLFHLVCAALLLYAVAMLSRSKDV